MDRIRSLIAGLDEQFEAMSPRDRMLATVLVCMLAIVAVGALTWVLADIRDDRASRVRVAKENFAEARELAADYTDVQRRIEAAETRMGQFKASQINTYLEGWANDAGLLPMLKEVRETGTQVVGDYRQRDYRIEIDHTELDPILRFLYAVETSPYPIKIRTARFKVQERKDVRTIEVGFEITTFSREEG